MQLTPPSCVNSKQSIYGQRCHLNPPMAAVLPFIQKSLLLGLVGIQSSLPLALVFSVRPVFAQAAHPAREAIAVVPEVAQATEPTDVGDSAEVNSGTTPGEAAPRSLAEPIAPAEKPTPQQPTPYQQRLDRIRQALDSRTPENQNPPLKQEFETQGKPSFSPKQRPPFTNFGNPGARPELLPTLTPNSAPQNWVQPIPVQQFPIQQAPAQQVPVQQGVLGSKFGRYRLGPNDVIFVNVQRFPNLNFQGPITPEGTIVLPLVGTVLLRDLTIGEASERVRVAYDRYIVSPQVNLSLISQRPVRVTVVGRVANPGFYGLTSAEISEALRLAGGTLASGDLRRVQIRRNSRSGQVIEQELDLYASVAQGVPFPDLRLEDGDTITIPQLPPDISSYDRTLVSNSTFASRQPVQVTVIGQVARPGFYVAQTGRRGRKHYSWPGAA
ncbi:MAG: hypothetical protein HC857_04375 [Synechococcales cyanobacterium RU_4_20]|nr:hypothetical protein [Synechococcales cyanobacterium RU_4_20]